jgi:hypothetical protein
MAERPESEVPQGPKPGRKGPSAARLKRLLKKSEHNSWNVFLVGAPAFMRGKERFSAPGKVGL